MAISKKKIDAIYDLREAAEAKAIAEKEASDHPSPQRRSELLDAQLTLEDKTIVAIEACHECGHEHEVGMPHGPAADVIALDVKRRRRPASPDANSGEGI
ncbi:MAG TPA: hypothetical protein VMF11_02355 [Candidatus Baltobacteraceae bacterium]|nr:hypothetical protein [Candidatus Baltobacteraceae bacterium]